MDYFKQHKTIEAYCSKLKTVPDPEDRKKLISFVDKFLSQKNEVQEPSVFYDSASDAQQVLQIAQMSLVKNDIPSCEQAPTDQTSSVMKDLKAILQEEAEAISRIAERKVREQLRLSQGKAPIKD